MTHASPIRLEAPVTGYQPGVCNIGPAEIARRRRAGHIQARMRFCAGFATAGVYNFGDVGPREPVTDRAALAADRVRGRRIYLASLVIGLAVGVVAVLLPI